MFRYEDDKLMKGFRLAPMTACSSELTAPDFQMANKFVMGCKFESWSEFDIESSKIEPQLCEALHEQGCHSSTSETCCRGAFQNPYCTNEGCRTVADYKQTVIEDRLKDDIHIRTHTGILLRGLRIFANKLRPSFSKGIERKPNPIITQELDLDTAISIQQPSQSWPDAVVQARCPNTSPLFPETKRGTSIASAYNNLREGIKESCELSYDMKSMGQLVKHTLFTRSGYGCLYNRNQAVFVKVCPNVTKTNTGLRVEHKVMLSREYKCDDEVSVLHGLLTLMIKGFEESSDEKRRMLDNHFRQVEASTITKNGELFVPLSRKRGYRGLPEHNGVVKDGKHRNGEGDREETWNECVEVSEEARERVRRAVAGGEPAVLNEIEMIRMFMTGSKAIGTGGSGTVLWSWVEGMKVAVKRWNWKKKHGLSWLLKEILVYKKLAKYDPEMLGTVVPRLIATCEYPEKEAVLVVEYVGIMPREKRPVDPECGTYMTNEKPEVEVDGMKLDDSEVEEIEKSATEGLRQLQRCGIYHRDAVINNLRVERVKELGDGTRWRTWWIDFGLVRLLEEEKFGDLTRVNELHIDEDIFSENWWRNTKPVFRLR